MPLGSLLAAVILALVHLYAGHLRFLRGIPRSRWLSLAGGASVAYVFVHLLPELQEGQEVLAEALGRTLSYLEHHIYLLSLLGLTTFYGLERAALTSRVRRGGLEHAASSRMFWLHSGSFALYNAIIGYLLLEREALSGVSLLTFSVAMTLHFVVNDYGLRDHYKQAYTRVGRWLLAGAVLLGWLLALVTEIREVVVSILVALLAGGIILNVLKEELPERRRSRILPFVFGAALYTALLLAI